MYIGDKYVIQDDTLYVCDGRGVGPQGGIYVEYDGQTGYWVLEDVEELLPGWRVRLEEYEGGTFLRSWHEADMPRRVVRALRKYVADSSARGERGAPRNTLG